MLSQKVTFSYFLWPIIISLFKYIPQLFIHSSTDGNLGCFHSLAIVNNAAMNIGVHILFQISVVKFFGYILRSGISGSMHAVAKGKISIFFF